MEIKLMERTGLRSGMACRNLSVLLVLLVTKSDAGVKKSLDQVMRII